MIFVYGIPVSRLLDAFKGTSAMPHQEPFGHPVVAGARRAAGRVIDVLMPHQCLRCGTVVDTPGTLCAVCWPRVRFLDRPWCARCGTPFAFEVGEGTICAECLSRPPAFERARAALAYDEESRGLVLAFKHADRTDAAAAYGGWMVRVASDLLADAEVIAPVPLHWTRLFVRRYNQAALLAQAVARHTGVPVVADLLIRRRRTPSLGRMGRDARRRALAGAFAVRPAYADRLRGRRVVLIDDVMTTGATVGGCARALARSGTAGVDVLTLARVS